MNILCPNCQKTLTVDEQHAGQLMKCPLCAGTFTVPALPPTPTDGGYTAQLAAAGGYSFAPPEPHAAAPPEPAPESATADKTPAPATGPAPPPPGYSHTSTIWLSPRVMPWVAPACLTLIFFLLFVNWNGLYPGGYGAYTQNAWQGIWAGVSADSVAEDQFKLKQELHRNTPVSWLIILYLLVFFPLWAVALASVAVPHFHVRPPPAVQQLMPWRSAIVAGLTLLASVLLILQLLAGLGLENGAANLVDKWATGEASEDEGSSAPFEALATSVEHAYKDRGTPEKQEKFAMTRGLALGAFSAHRTVWLRLVILLNAVALIGAGLDFWLSRRVTRPLPRADLSW